jgi:holo-[acyl-carrier protein] synthase
VAIFCGVDIVEIDRIRNSLESCGEEFKNRVYTKNEIEYCENRKAARFESYAARFSAKEAVSKAFGTGIGKRVGWKDIEVVNDSLGKPSIVLSGNARELFEEMKGVSISLSLSHSRQYAVAYVMLEVEGVAK